MSASPDRPLITFALISYRDEKFVREAVRGAFTQTYQPLEIILSNDCSPDSTFETMRNMADRYEGPHRLLLNRNEKNLGTAGHINRIMQMSHGELIVIAAGDDVSLPERTARLFEAYRSTKKRAKSLCSSRIIIDGEGRTRDIFRDSGPKDRFVPERLVESDYILTGSTHAWSREVFDTFGPLLTPLSCEDMVIPFRSALLGDILYLDEPLVKYRRHGENSWPDGGFVKRKKFFTFQEVVICKNWLRDLDTYAGINPGELSRIAGLRTRIRERLVQAEENAFLFNSSWIRRACFLLSKPVNRTTLRKVLQKIGLFLTPSLYEQYIELSYRLHGKKTANTRGEGGA